MVFVAIVDIDACAITPCGNNTSCIDKLPPADGTAQGRRCFCDVGYDGSNPDIGCTGELLSGTFWAYVGGFHSKTNALICHCPLESIVLGLPFHYCYCSPFLIQPPYTLQASTHAKQRPVASVHCASTNHHLQAAAPPAARALVPQATMVTQTFAATVSAAPIAIVLFSYKGSDTRK